MAVLKRSLRRKNATGNYDTIRLESDSSIVYRPSGRTVEQDLAAYLPSTQSSDVVPKTLSFGKIVTGQSRLFAGGQDNILELALQPSNLIDTSDATATATDIRSGKTAYVDGSKITGSMKTVTLGTPTITVSSSGLITAKVTHSSTGYVASGTKTKTLQLSSSQDSDFIASNIKKGVTIFGITGTLVSSSIPDTPSVGQTMVYKGFNWIVVDRTSNAAVIAMDSIVGTCQFININQTLSEFKSRSGITDNLFIPTEPQVFDTYQYYQTRTNRICGGNSWWTSTISGNGPKRAWYVDYEGYRDEERTGVSGSLLGVRPHLNISL